MRPTRIQTLAIFLACSAASAADRPPRYAALLASGQRLEGDRLSNWYDANGLPHLGGQSLLAPSNPLRWLRNRSQRPAELPPAFVEFTNGDRLPGVVVDYRSGMEEVYDPQPPHFIVRVALTFEPPDNRPAAEIRVATQFVRRIVWQRRGQGGYQPGTASYRDGRSLPLRAVRFHAGEVHALTGDGERRIDWSELAELDLPPVDPWTAWFDQLAALCPTRETRLIEIETSSGLVATASLARLAARFEGNSADADRWVHGVQPAWSLDILWIAYREIAYYRTFAPHEVPLSRILPRRIVQQGAVGGLRSVQVNQSVVGTPLRNQSLEFGWGLGVVGGTDVTFDLPSGAVSLRTFVCLDRTAGNGGCIRPRIFANEAKDRPLWEGPVIVGSETVVDTGPIRLGRSGTGPMSIVLEIDAVTTGRPAGADPLDIRDHADWCDPLLELDPTVVGVELERRLPRHFAAWREWIAEVAGGTPTDAGLEISFHRNEQLPGAFEPAIRVRRIPFVLRREVTIGPHDNWLVIAAMHLRTREDEPQLEVRIGGQQVARLTIPDRQADPNDCPPLVVPLAAFQRAGTVTLPVEIRQQADERGPAVEYRSITVAEQLPTVYCVLEEQATLAAVDTEQTGNAAMIDSDHYVGARSLRLTPTGRFRLELSTVVRVRAQPKWGEARFLRFAVRKHGGGRVAVELEDSHAREQPARYDLGRGGPSYGAANRIWEDNLPNDWIVITRDLHADFGNIDVRALVVGCPDGESALIDHVYFARSRSDLDSIPKEDTGRP